MPLTIRYATAADAHDIAILSRQTFHDTFASFNTKEDMDLFMNGPFSLDLLTAELDTPANTFIAAFMDEELVGYAKIVQSPNPPELGDSEAIEISRLYASKKAIGQGVGKALMEKCISIGLEKSKTLIWLGVWEHNLRAIAFYRKFGFEKFGEHNFLLGNDVQTDWLMKLKI